jgi:hypothetical protein
MTKVTDAFFRVLICLAAAAAWGSGCSVERLHLVKMGDLFIEPISSCQVHFSDITVRQDGEDLLISGDVSRRNPSFSGAGRVDVAVVSPAGMVIDTATAPYTPPILPKTPGARKHHSSHFEVRLRCDPPQSSIVRIAYHARGVSSDLMPDSENFALPDDHDYGG